MKKPAHHIYRSIVDHVNNETYLAQYHASYSTAKLPEEYLTGSMIPFTSHAAEDPMDTVTGRVTIADMVEMMTLNVGFTIIYLSDVLHVKQHLDKYLRLLVRHKDNEGAQAYLTKAAPLQIKLTKQCGIISRNTKAMDSEQISKQMVLDILTNGLSKEVMERYSAKTD